MKKLGLIVAAATVAAAAGSALAAKGDPLNNTFVVDSSLISTNPTTVGGNLTQVNISGLTTNDEFGDLDNIVLLIPLGAGVSVTGVGWDVTITAPAPSWLSEIAVNFGNSSGLAAGSVDIGFSNVNAPGGPVNDSTAGAILKLADFNIPDVVLLPDGLLRIELWDAFDDNPGLADGIFNQGILTFQWIPTPGTLAFAGLAGLAGLRRRRR